MKAKDPPASRPLRRNPRQHSTGCRSFLISGVDAITDLGTSGIPTFRLIVCLGAVVAVVGFGVLATPAFVLLVLRR